VAAESSMLRTPGVFLAASFGEIPAGLDLPADMGLVGVSVDRVGVILADYGAGRFGGTWWRIWRGSGDVLLGQLASPHRDGRSGCRSGRPDDRPAIGSVGSGAWRSDWSRGGDEIGSHSGRMSPAVQERVGSVRS